jgi:hypothetical protein
MEKRSMKVPTQQIYPPVTNGLKPYALPDTNNAKPYKQSMKGVINSH